MALSSAGTWLYVAITAAQRLRSTCALLPQPSLTRTCGWWPLVSHSLASGFGFVARASVRGQRGFSTPGTDGSSPDKVGAVQDAR